MTEVFLQMSFVLIVSVAGCLFWNGKDFDLLYHLNLKLKGSQMQDLLPSPILN